MTTEELTDFRPLDYWYMSASEYHDGVKQMLADLEQLARADGCIAAAWALAVLRELPAPERPRPELPPGDERAVAWAVAEIERLRTSNATLKAAACQLESLCQLVAMEPCVPFSLRDRADEALADWQAAT